MKLVTIMYLWDYIHSRGEVTKFGSVDQIADELIRRREAYGISYITVGEDAMEPFAAVVEKLNGK